MREALLNCIMTRYTKHSKHLLVIYINIDERPDPEKDPVSFIMA